MLDGDTGGGIGISENVVEVKRIEEFVVQSQRKTCLIH